MITHFDNNPIKLKILLSLFIEKQNIVIYFKILFFIQKGEHFSPNSFLSSFYHFYSLYQEGI